MTTRREWLLVVVVISSAIFFFFFTSLLRCYHYYLLLFSWILLVLPPHHHCWHHLLVIRRRRRIHHGLVEPSSRLTPQKCGQLKSRTLAIDATNLWATEDDDNIDLRLFIVIIISSGVRAALSLLNDFISKKSLINYLLIIVGSPATAIRLTYP